MDWETLQEGSQGGQFISGVYVRTLRGMRKPSVAERSIANPARVQPHVQSIARKVGSCIGYE